MFSLKGKIALVTGAKGGMGRAHALSLALQGAKVVVTDVGFAECEKVVKEIEAAGGEAMALEMNVADKKIIDAVVDAVVKKWGRIDVLVNNAGVYNPTPALELSEEEWNKTLDINLKGQFLCAQKVANEMAKHKWGRIINIASVASGQVGFGIAGGVHYSASKGGIIAMTESLAAEWAHLGINVNAIAPGAIDTPMSRKARMTPEQFNDFLSARVPLKRIGEPDEVSAAVVFLASDEASYVTGATIYVDGGWLAM